MSMPQIMGLNEKPTLPEHVVYKWKSTKKTFVYWDWEKEVEIKLPIKFLVILQTAKLTWFIDWEWAIWSNEIIDYKNEIITCRCWDRILAKWTYQNIKDVAKSAWAKFTIVVYALLNDKFAKLELWGAARTEYIESGVGLWDLISVSKTKSGKKWATVYHFPEFDKLARDEEIFKKWLVISKDLKDYFEKREVYYKDLYESKNSSDEDKPQAKMSAEEMEARLKATAEKIANKDLKPEELPF